MTLAKLQNYPFNLKLITLKLSIMDEYDQCLYGQIEKLKLIDIPIFGMFIRIEGSSDPFPYENIIYIKTFYYLNPKSEFEENDCNQATHFIMASDINATEKDNKNFLQRLSSSDINKKMQEPCIDPYHES